MHASLAVWSALHQVTIPSTWLPHTTAVTVTVRAAMMGWLGVPQPSPVIIMRAATTGLATVAEPVVHMRRRLVLLRLLVLVLGLGQLVMLRRLRVTRAGVDRASRRRRREQITPRRPRRCTAIVTAAANLALRLCRHLLLQLLALALKASQVSKLLLSALPLLALLLGLADVHLPLQVLRELALRLLLRCRRLASVRVHVPELEPRVPCMP